ncbi:winged helix-turn-helix domain-containing protein [Actinomadura sp. DC4]|uniref:GntR family transcriptional regulator n=1 Tax=Actinomadura sp. DC4 TaxID=3055069 RepID=UPI0025B25FA6|nr:winged helix-turn-helix domain-containing protein [Actinomadura sp. DC4]MDN3356103.1 winged helix-turn-helix domain-containing protein [Actinomadura sp. DC4]
MLPENDDDDVGPHPDIRPGAPTPLYEQVADLIEARVRAGELKVESRLPAERDLRDYYGVAYVTIRRAMEILRERGTVQTVHGRGTFVVRMPRSK